MGKNNKFKEKEEASYKRELKNIDTKQGKKEPLIVFSLKDFDKSQGQSSEEWQKENLLSLVFNKLNNISQLTKIEATAQQIIKQYPNFPPDTEFKHPKHILPDVAWCSMRIQGKERVIGYFEDNIFYIVFLDKNHEFWISEKKNT